MNAFSKAQKGYSSNSVTTQTDRRAEYDLIARLTHRMRASAIEGTQRYPEYVQALYDNRKLWNALAIDVADKDNELPSQLRAQLFYLAEFTAQHTTKILKDGLSVAPLLEINMAVLRGLKTGGSVH